MCLLDHSLKMIYSRGVNFQKIEFECDLFMDAVRLNYVQSSGTPLVIIASSVSATYDDIA